ncbi:Lar family restriction alleviation protein [Comamonas aquatica]|uniref:Lar family restriction alleviation protein n=1 Tax=Comamonas aquatica TaxID=225991 RepID=UPI0024487D5C|nr:Lar family restriction alleviation protein [Comamonas aquatica]MDH0493336.1 Lar family restriction alleviation protein [Comamonas aquatica]
MTHHTDAELLPCPFCGSRARRSKGGGWHGTGCAGAHGCPAYLSALTYRTQEEADEAWNRRTPASQAQRVPLSERKIRQIDAHSGLDAIEFARAIERAHGIGKDKA